MGRQKNTPESRQDQENMHERDNLNPEKYQGPASYALTKEEKKIFFEVLSSIKVPSGFSSNIKGIINMTEQKFQNLKSHDCHVIMTQLSGCIEGASAGKCSSTHCEAMCIS